MVWARGKRLLRGGRSLALPPRISYNGCVGKGGLGARRAPLAGWLATLLISIAAVGLFSVAGSMSAVATGINDPNVLVIITDDQPINSVNGWMPNTTKWFRDGAAGITGGVEFTNAFATNPLCCPSRASMFTGRYSHNHKIFVRGDLTTVAPGAPNYSEFHSTTLQHYLQTRPAQPYTTGIIGKYLNFWPLANSPPGFDRWSIWDNGVHYSSGATPICNNGLNGVNCINQDGTLVAAPVNLYETDYAAQRVSNFVSGTEANDGKPWMLYVTPGMPHVPSTPQNDANKNYSNTTVPAFTPDASQFPANDNGKPEYVRDTRDRAYNQGIFADEAPYVCNEGSPPGTVAPDVYRLCVIQRREAQYRMLKSMDDLVETIFTTLRANGEEEDTLAFFISDNGMQYGEFWLEGKPHPYEDATRVPMFMRWPANTPRVPADFTDTRLTANLDITATVLQATGAAPQPGIPMDGRSLLDPDSATAFRRSEILLERPGRAQTADPANDTRERHVNHPPTWASLRSAPESLDYSQYTEYYPDNDSTIGNPTANFYELYQFLGDPLALNNAFGSNGLPDVGEPDPTARSAALSAARRCAGVNGELLPLRPSCP